jgi:hypothetical protein
MTDIDPTSDIELHTVDEHVVVRVPLTGPTTGEWLRRYQRLARATGVPVQTQAQPDRTWIVVSVPADGNQREVAATMDAARALIAEADAGERAPAAAQAESIVRDWWARRRDGAPRRPVSKAGVARTGIGTEKRWPLFGAPAVVRVLSLALVVVLVAEAAGVTARLVIDLVEGGPETNSATDLLSVGFGVWVYTILAFSFLYWVLDGGGPDARLWTPPEYPDLAFPEQLNPVVAVPGWRPQFFDYLYLGFTNATAFSPTDVMPLARWGKAAMTIQAAGSLAILGLVIARAVNILQ